MPDLPGGSVVVDVPLGRVRPMCGQPRSYFDKNALEELAESLKAIGQVVPAQVTRVTGDRRHDYELIDGQRRWHAAEIAGLAALRCEVIDEPDPEARFTRSVVANLSRQPNHPMEIALACQRMRKSMTVEKVAATLGKSVSWVNQHVSLLKLHPDLQSMLHPTTPKANRLPFAAALKLASLPHDRQKEAIGKILASGLSRLRATDAVLAAMPETEVAPPDKEGGRQGTRPPKDRYEKFFGLVQRSSLMLRDYEPGHAKSLLSARKPTERDAVRSLLKAIADHAAELLRVL